ncbi:MAG: hypothetical protein R6V57_10990, partial [Vicinamibacterales bacterium]
MDRTDHGPAEARGNASDGRRVSRTDRTTLYAIAHRAMLERGLEPDFPPAAQREAAAMSGPAGATGRRFPLRRRREVRFQAALEHGPVSDGVERG